jgi:hypothetical protein
MILRGLNVCFKIFTRNNQSNVFLREGMINMNGIAMTTKKCVHPPLGLPFTIRGVFIKAESILDVTLRPVRLFSTKWSFGRITHFQRSRISIFLLISCPNGDSCTDSALSTPTSLSNNPMNKLHLMPRLCSAIVSCNHFLLPSCPTF